MHLENQMRILSMEYFEKQEFCSLSLKTHL